MLGNCVSAEESDSAVGWFRSIQTQEKSGDDAYKNLLRKIYSGQYKIISFNIFDTLVVRPFVPPSDIFTLLNVPFQRMFELNSFADFSEQRRSAEEFCRISYGKTKFVDLNDIYDALARNYGYDREKLQTIQALELENEISFGYPRKFLVELFELAKKQVKRSCLQANLIFPANVSKKYCVDAVFRDTTAYSFRMNSIRTRSPINLPRYWIFIKAAVFGQIRSYISATTPVLISNYRKRREFLRFIARLPLNCFKEKSFRVYGELFCENL